MHSASCAFHPLPTVRIGNVPQPQTPGICRPLPGSSLNGKLWHQLSSWLVANLAISQYCTCTHQSGMSNRHLTTCVSHRSGTSMPWLLGTMVYNSPRLAICLASQSPRSTSRSLRPPRPRSICHPAGLWCSLCTSALLEALLGRTLIFLQIRSGPHRV